MISVLTVKMKKSKMVFQKHRHHLCHHHFFLPSQPLFSQQRTMMKKKPGAVTSIRCCLTPMGPVQCLLFTCFLGCFRSVRFRVSEFILQLSDKVTGFWPKSVSQILIFPLIPFKIFYFPKIVIFKFTLRHCSTAGTLYNDQYRYRL